MSEHAEQCRLMRLARLWEGEYPELALLHAIPLGGLRHKATARRMKAEGAKAGVPDLCLPVARGKYHGLYIEMKFGRNKPTEAQQWWIEQLRNQGYYVQVCHGCDVAWDVIVGYLEGSYANT